MITDVAGAGPGAAMGACRTGGAMFIQVIQGRVIDTEAARVTLERWRRDVEPGAVGWLGGTFGFTDDGTLAAVVRFESAEAAAANAGRPEQQAWWRDMERHFTGGPAFHDCSDVTLLIGREPDQAGFVQIIQGRVRDRERLRSLSGRAAELIAEHRPDIVGATISIDDEGNFTETVAFSTEAAAREAEARPMPPEARDVLAEEMSLLDDVTYLDLHQPWFASRR